MSTSHCIANFLLSLAVKEFLKSVKIWQSYGQNLGASFFLEHGVVTVMVTLNSASDYIGKRTNRLSHYRANILRLRLLEFGKLKFGKIKGQLASCLDLSWDNFGYIAVERFSLLICFWDPRWSVSLTSICEVKCCLNEVLKKRCRRPPMSRLVN